MLAHAPHPWQVSPAYARAIQQELAAEVIAQDDFGEIRRIAGADIGFEDHNRITRAAISVLDYVSLEPVEEVVVRLPTRFPYVPGLLSFREVPALLDALQSVKQLPDMILCDGQGLAHPRRFGLASHLGVVTDIPTIGVAKSRLIGRYQEPGSSRGDWSALLDDGETIGYVLRTRSNTQPLFISIGHRVSLASARRIVLHCCPRFRLPETTRRAHHLASVAPAIQH